MDKKILVGSAAYLEMEGRLNSDGLYAIIMDLPFKCNHDCQKCYRTSNMSMEDLDLELRKGVIRQARDLGARVMYIPGEGEPLLHKEVTRDLAAFNDSLGLITILYTNGSLLDEDTARFLFDHNVSLITSVDSFDPEVHKELAGRRDLYMVKRNLEKARDIYRTGIRREDIIKTRLALITIITQQNKDEISEIRDWCGNEVFYICNFPIKAGSAVKNWDKLVGDNLQELREISHRFTETGYAGLSAPLKDGRCSALYNGVTIDTDGEVLVCPASVDTSVGNIKDADLKVLWEKVRTYAEQNGRPSCIARDGREKTFRLHDGTIVQHL